MIDTAIPNKPKSQSADGAVPSTSNLTKAGKERKDPSIELTSFITYKSDAGVYTFDPAPRKIKGKGNSMVVTLGDVPLPPGVPAPENALTTLYGFRDQLDELQLQHGLARSRGMSLVKVSWQLPVGTIIMATADPTNIATTKFLNLRRINRDLQDVLVAGINELALKESKGGKNKITVFSKLTEAGARPDLICRVVRSIPLFSHINSVVYTVPDGSPRGRQVATIFTTEDVREYAVRGEAPFQVELPKL